MAVRVRVPGRSPREPNPPVLSGLVPVLPTVRARCPLQPSPAQPRPRPQPCALLCLPPAPAPAPLAAAAEMLAAPHQPGRLGVAWRGVAVLPTARFGSVRLGSGGFGLPGLAQRARCVCLCVCVCAPERSELRREDAPSSPPPPPARLPLRSPPRSHVTAELADSPAPMGVPGCWGVPGAGGWRGATRARLAGWFAGTDPGDDGTRRWHRERERASVAPFSQGKGKG